MGQKTHPRGFRLGIVANWKSRWYAERNFPQLLAEDETLRKYLHQRLGHASISEVEIERKPSKVILTIHTARPGVVIGKGGSEVDKLRDELGRLTTSEVAINVEEIKRPEIEGQLIADSIAHQLVQRYKEGRIPLHTLRADIDYAQSTARTTFGTIGVKVWVFKGEVVEDRRGRTYSTDL